MNQSSVSAELAGWGYHPLVSGTYARIDRVAIEKRYILSDEF